MAREARLVTPTFVAVTAASLAYFSGLGMLLPTLPRYVADELGGSGLAVGVVAGSFAFSAAVVRPWVGRAGDRRGRRLLVVGGSLVVAASVAAYTLVDTIVPLVLLRVVSGVGEAAVFVGAATAIQDMAPAHRRGEAASYFSVSIFGGLAIGPPIGEALLDVGYDAVWLVTAAAMAIAAVIGITTPVGPVGEPALTDGRRRLLHPAALGPGSVLALSLAGLACFDGFLALYVDDLGIGDAAPYFVVYGLVILAVRIFGARIPDRVGPNRTAVAAVVQIAVGLLVMATWQSSTGLYVGTVVFSLGQSLQFPALMRLVMDVVPDAERTSAMATFSMFFDLSQGVGLIVLGSVVALASEASAFAASALFALLSLVVLRRVLSAAHEVDHEGAVV